MSRNSLVKDLDLMKYHHFHSHKEKAKFLVMANMTRNELIGYILHCHMPIIVFFSCFWSFKKNVMIISMRKLKEYMLYPIKKFGIQKQTLKQIGL